VRGKAGNWAKWLRAGEDAAMVETIRASSRTGRPAGNAAFIARIEKLTGRTLRARKVGRPRKGGRPRKDPKGGPPRKHG
ncbi:MAG: hypothetical protein NTY65_00540, partial [Planctomycetota bacterium]|nr:hypothetical protein [Planctomycetota bacterium]